MVYNSFSNIESVLIHAFLSLPKPPISHDSYSRWSENSRYWARLINDGGVYGDFGVYSKFPKRIPIGNRNVGWLESEVDAWIAERIQPSKYSTRG